MKYYYISFRIDINGSPFYGHELTDKTPLEYVIYWKKIGGHYGERVILFADEITKSEYDVHSEQIND